jgi:hypothetical protein
VPTVLSGYRICENRLFYLDRFMSGAIQHSCDERNRSYTKRAFHFFKVEMPTQTLIDIQQTYTRRADPDPIVRVGESFDANGVYQYTFLRVGTVKLIFKERKRARRTLNHLHDSLSEALLRFAMEQPLNDHEPDDFPYEEDEDDAEV